MTTMNINLTQKERLLFEDQKRHEELCIQKYTNYANQAQDPQLKQLFNTHAQHERQHLNTINQILAGQVPDMQAQNQQKGQQGQAGHQGMSNNQQQMYQQQMHPQQTYQQQQSYQQQTHPQQTYQQPGMFNQSQAGTMMTNAPNANDIFLCNDMLATEKHVSSTYDTAIFEMTDTNVRKALNHIQKEEQQHGEDLFNYLKSKGMYNTQ